MDKNIRKIIDRKIDFSKRENMVIDALIYFKMVRSVGKIAHKSGLSWSTTSYILHKLEKKRLAIKVVKKTKVKQHFLWRLKRIPPSASANTTIKSSSLVK